MSNYRRLISYIYEYEGKAKGRNVGFAKLESRGSQCKISVNVKKIFTGGDAGVYLLIPGGEIPLGKMFVRGGAGEFRTAVQSDDIDGNGSEMDLCYGLTIHEPEESWRTYRTIWEDEVAYAAEIELSRARPKEEVSVEESAKKIIQEIEEEISGQEKRTSEEETKAPESVPAIKVKPPAALKNPENRRPPEPGLPQMPPESVPPKLPAAPPELTPPRPPEPVRPEKAPEPTIRPEKMPEPPRPEIPAAPEGPEIPAQPVNSPGPMLKAPAAPAPLSVGIGRDELPRAGIPGELEGLKLEEEPETNPAAVWSAFEKTYPKIQAFDSEHGCVILVIKPQDLGLLPREVWVYGNNSFLLHGYYSYRYIILARLENPNGRQRFLLGIPGHYYSNEKYMASMFGFPNFVLSKKQPAGDGRFGYWYTDIQLGGLEINAS